MIRRVIIGINGKPVTLARPESEADIAELERDPAVDLRESFGDAKPQKPKPNS